MTEINPPGPGVPPVAAAPPNLSVSIPVATPAPASFWPVAANLIGLIALGVSICAWFLFYTDLFPEVVGLLGLGGLFAWIAFLSNLLSEDRKKELQRRFDERVLSPRRTLIWIGAAAAGFFTVIAPLWGALVVSTVRDDKERTIEIRSLGRDGRWSEVEVGEKHLAPRSDHIYSLLTPWFGRRQFQVKVSGLPARPVEIAGWHRRPLSVPAEFDLGRQPILLVHLTPEANIMVQPPQRPGRLQLFQNGKLLGELSKYRGENVWVGGDDDIAIPEWMTTRWRLALGLEKMGPEHLARWEPTRSLAPTLEVRTGPGLEIRFIPPSGVELHQAVTVAPPYPQEVSIDVPE